MILPIGAGYEKNLFFIYAVITSVAEDGNESGRDGGSVACTKENG